LIELELDTGIILNYSSNYYLQGNGVADSTNKNLIRILKKTTIENHWNWKNALHNALWDDRVTPKEALGNSPYFLVYRQEAIFPTNLYLPYLQLSQSSSGHPSSSMQPRIDTLLMIEEEREQYRRKFAVHQQIVKK
jgi:hypothetical protein